jgi:uncharacterized protein YkwD
MKSSSKIQIRTFALWTALTIALFTIIPTSLAIAGEQSPLSAEESEFVTLLNRLRTRLNLNPLTLHPSLQAAARKHSAWMADQDRILRNGDQLTHNGPGKNDTLVTRAKDREGYVYRRLGENIACGFPDAKRIFKLWAYSPVHLANMIHPHFREIGIAREGDGSEDCPYYWTNDFGTRILDKPTSNNKPSAQQIEMAIQELTGEDTTNSETP